MEDSKVDFEKKIISPILGFDPFILMEFRVEDGQLEMGLQFSHVQREEIPQILRDAATLIERGDVDE